MKILKYLLLAAGGFVLVLGAIAAYVAATFDPNAYKPEIIKLVKEKKNRTLTLEGAIRLSFWPNVGAELGKASLSEFRSDREFASVEDARVSVKLMPLLSRQMVVDEVTVKGARATIVRFKDGKMNIDDLLGEEQKDKAQPVVFDIAQVTVENSGVTFRDEAKRAQYSLSGVNLKTGRVANKVPTKIDFAANVQSSEPKMSLNATLKTRLTFDLDQQVYNLEDLGLDAKGDAGELRNVSLKATGSVTAKLKTNEFLTEKLSVSVTGASGKENLEVKLDAPRLVLTSDKASGEKVALVYKATGPQSTLNATLTLPGIEGNSKAFKSSAMTADVDLKQGDLSVKAKIASPVSGNLESRQLSLPGLAANITASGPDIPGKTLSGELKGSAAVDGAKESVQASIAGKIADSTLKGRLAISHFAAPAFNFDLEVDQLDVDRYFPPAPPGKPDKQPEKPLDLSALKSLNANGTLRIGSLKFNNIKATNVKLDVKAGGGRVDVNPLTANLYQGSLSSAATINAAGATPAFAVKHNMTGISIAPFLKDLANNETLEGKGNVTLDVTTQGATTAALKKALNGNASLKLVDGAVKGIDIAGTLRNAKAKLGTLRGEQTQQANKAEKTDFSELTGTFNIKNGVAHNSDLLLKSPLLRVGGEGDVNIGEDSLNYLVKAAVVATTKGQGGRDLSDLSGVTVPVRVTGPLASPSYKLDFNAIATDVAKQKVQSELEKRLGGMIPGAAPAAKAEAPKDAKSSASGGNTAKDALKGLFGR